MKTTIIAASSMSLEQRRALLDSAGGRFFEVTFLKADGTEREMNVKKWTEAAFTYGSANAQANTVKHKPEYYTAVDMAKGAFRNINLTTLKRVKINGIEYRF